ncbi:hypothetical protein BVRB_5g109150 [Beta vulgaris subsp. vulgaris]|nr:hypothetical protein BVRB_5g109150 [Beta vulgaris subsp. vulgaris]
MYRFTKHLSIFRTQIRRWCLDHKVVWGIDWRELSTKLAATATHISTLPQGNDFMLQRQQELDTSALAHSYWSQRSKDKYVQLGDLPTKFFYNKMRQKQRSAYIYLLRTADNQWTEDGPTIVKTILHHFKTAYGPSQGPTVSDQGQDEAIDLVLRELNLPHLSLSQQQQLLRLSLRQKCMRPCLVLVRVNLLDWTGPRLSFSNFTGVPSGMRCSKLSITFSQQSLLRFKHPRTKKLVELYDDPHLSNMWGGFVGMDTVEVFIEETQQPPRFVLKSLKDLREAKKNSEAEILRKIAEEKEREREEERKRQEEEEALRELENQLPPVAIEIPVYNVDDLSDGVFFSQEEENL